jgi:hypothetical protein
VSSRLTKSKKRSFIVVSRDVADMAWMGTAVFGVRLIRDIISIFMPAVVYMANGSFGAVSTYHHPWRRCDLCHILP